MPDAVTPSPSPRQTPSTPRATPAALGTVLDLPGRLGAGWTVGSTDVSGNIVLTKPDGDSTRSITISETTYARVKNLRVNKNRRKPMKRLFAREQTLLVPGTNDLRVIADDAAGNRALVSGMVHGQFVQKWMDVKDVNRAATQPGFVGDGFFAGLGVSPVSQKPSETAKKDERETEAHPQTTADQKSSRTKATLQPVSSEPPDRSNVTVTQQNLDAIHQAEARTEENDDGVEDDATAKTVAPVEPMTSETPKPPSGVTVVKQKVKVLSDNKAQIVKQKVQVLTDNNRASYVPAVAKVDPHHSELSEQFQTRIQTTITQFRERARELGVDISQVDESDLKGLAKVLEQEAARFENDLGDRHKSEGELSRLENLEAEAHNIIKVDSLVASSHSSDSPFNAPEAMVALSRILPARMQYPESSHEQDISPSEETIIQETIELYRRQQRDRRAAPVASSSTGNGSIGVPLPVAPITAIPKPIPIGVPQLPSRTWNAMQPKSSGRQIIHRRNRVLGLSPSATVGADLAMDQQRDRHDPDARTRALSTSGGLGHATTMPTPAPHGTEAEEEDVPRTEQTDRAQMDAQSRKMQESKALMTGETPEDFDDAQTAETPLPTEPPPLTIESLDKERAAQFQQQQNMKQMQGQSVADAFEAEQKKQLLARELARQWRMVNMTNIAHGTVDVLGLFVALVTMNVQMMNKLSLKLPMIPPTTFPVEDGGVVCADCCACFGCMSLLAIIIGIVLLFLFPLYRIVSSGAFQALSQAFTF